MEELQISSQSRAIPLEIDGVWIDSGRDLEIKKMSQPSSSIASKRSSKYHSNHGEHDQKDRMRSRKRKDKRNSQRGVDHSENVGGEVDNNGYSTSTSRTSDRQAGADFKHYSPERSSFDQGLTPESMAGSHRRLAMQLARKPASSSSQQMLGPTSLRSLRSSSSSAYPAQISNGRRVFVACVPRFFGRSLE